MTIAASLLRLPPRLPLRRERWELADGDFLDLDWLDGPSKTAPLLLVCHGLEGSSRSGYILGILALAQAQGLSAVALNFRSCSGELNRLLRFYHSGETSDLALLIDRLLLEAPQRLLGLVGFSLGGNVVAKYLGERGDSVPQGVRAGAVISVPYDLEGCCRAIDGPGLPQLLYRERFLQRLRKKALAKERLFPGSFSVQRLRAARRLREFDEIVTAPLHGFDSAADYYARSSSGPLLHAVRRPLLAISAYDDPMVPGHTLPLLALHANPHISAKLCSAGGHVGFLSGPPWRWRHWAEEQAVEFLSAQLKSSSSTSHTPLH